jgi:aspartyl/asparaginyl beta-hydroxylase (cupin superfamily)
MYCFVVLWCAAVLLAGYVLWKTVVEVNIYRLCSIWNHAVDSANTVQNDILRSLSIPFYKDTPEGRAFGKINSLCPARACPFLAVRNLERDIVENHDAILLEVRSLMSGKYVGTKMIDIDDVQRAAFPDQNGWSILSVKFFDRYSAVGELLPTLTNIVKKHEDIISLLHVSCMAPGVELRPHTGITGSVLRYHYGLEIPAGPCALLIDHLPFKWTNREGVVWDDTIPHAALNRSNEMRLVIFADIYRQDMPLWIRAGNYVVQYIAQRSKHVKSIQQRLNEEGKHID